MGGDLHEFTVIQQEIPAKQLSGAVQQASDLQDAEAQEKVQLLDIDLGVLFKKVKIRTMEMDETAKVEDIYNEEVDGMAETQKNILSFEGISSEIKDLI